MRGRRLAWLCIAVLGALWAGCDPDVAPATSGVGDELDRSGPTWVILPDGGTHEGLAPRPIGSVDTQHSLPLPTQPNLGIAPHDCADPCPGPCGPDEACCWSMQRCVRLDCPTCCPDPDFMSVALRTAAADR